MNTNLYAIFDLVADEFGPVFEAKNDEVASRQFRLMFKRESVTNFEDFDLYCLGSIDHQTALFYPNVDHDHKPFVISRGSSIVFTKPME